MMVRRETISITLFLLSWIGGEVLSRNAVVDLCARGTVKANRAATLPVSSPTQRKFSFTEHAAMRAKERYGLELKQADARKIVKLCKTAIKIKNKNNLFLVEYKKTPMLVALDTRNRKIITCLTL